jgi:hypothetical protein
MTAELVSAMRHGVCLGFSTPTILQFDADNYASVVEYLPAVEKEIERLTASGKVEEVTTRLWIVNPLGAVAKKDSDKKDNYGLHRFGSQRCTDTTSHATAEHPGRITGSRPRLVHGKI